MEVSVRTIVLAIGLVGCWSEGNYLPKLGRTYCSALQECDRGAFDGEYNDVDDCVDEYLDVLEPSQECAEEVECEFDAAEAKGCDEAVRKADCEDFAEGDWADDCDKIYDCDDDQLRELGECLADG